MSTSTYRSLAWSLLHSLAVVVTNASAEAIMAGRPVDPHHDFSVSLTVGQFTDIQGSVRETTRQLFTLQGRDDKQRGSTYDFNQLGLSESDLTYGIDVEKRWRYLTLRTDLTYMHAEASAVPVRDYFLRVDRIKFQGRNYEYMKLEDDQPYDASIDAALLHGRLQYTPFTIAPDNIVSFTPWVHLGLLVMAGQFEVDQGDPQRVQIYQNPPHEFVVGGHGEGDVQVFSPEFGGGGEILIYLGQSRCGGNIELALQGTYSIFKYQGSQGGLGISSDHDKDLDVDYAMYETRALLSWPITLNLDFLVGAEYRVITADASSKAKPKTLEEAEITREKFDKDVHVELTSVNGFAGLRW